VPIRINTDLLVITNTILKKQTQNGTRHNALGQKKRLPKGQPLQLLLFSIRLVEYFRQTTSALNADRCRYSL
jgi:hypothetical protein